MIISAMCRVSTVGMLLAVPVVMVVGYMFVCSQPNIAYALLTGGLYDYDDITVCID